MSNSRAGRNGVLLIMALGLGALFVFSFVYRIENPSLTRRVEVREQDHGEAGGMGQIAALMERLNENPDDPAVLTALGEAFMTIGSWDRAALFLERALQSQPENVMLLNQLAMSTFRAGNHEEAAEYLNRVLEHDPDNVTAHFNLGILYKHYLDDPDQAGEHFRAVLEAPDAEAGLKEQAAQEIQE
ncbi:MAG: tetratricopeptide repeat protein [Desulfohalobiaceae bacterium]